MQKIKPFNSFEGALADDVDLLQTLNVRNNDDLNAAAQRISEIAHWVPKYETLYKNFTLLPREEQEIFAKKMVNLYRIVYHDVKFRKEYASLSPNGKQAVLMQILSLHRHGNKLIRWHKLSEEERRGLWKKFEQSMIDNGIYIDRKFHTPVLDDEKKIIRWDCYGLIEEPETKNLSEAYSAFRKQKDVRKIKDNFKYDLMTSPVIAYGFAQFKNFYQVQDMLQDALRFSNVPPSLLPELKARDFADIIYKRFKDGKYRTIPLFMGSKYEFVKYIGNKYQNEILKAHHAMGIDERYTRSLIREMKMNGHSCNITPLEYIATQKQLDELTELGINCKGIKPGDTYSDEFCEMLFQKEAYKPLIAYDARGEMVIGPEYDVDHKSPVDEAGGKRIGNYPNIQAANNWTNYRLVEKNTHELFIHSADITQIFGEKKAEKEESYISRLKLPDDNIVLMFGVDKSQWISHDVSKHPYLLAQLKYFNEEYLPMIAQAENYGKVSYEQPSPSGKEVKIVHNEDKKHYPNKRMNSEAIRNSRGRR